jgi:cysteine desulfurase
MKRIYLDNASTTMVDQEVYEAMLPYIINNYGNPSALDKYGRQAKVAIEQERKKIADIFNTSPANIFFVSGGTEANNMALYCSVHSFDVKNIITSPLEHLSVLNTLKFLANKFKINLNYVEIDSKGHINYENLDTLLSKLKGKTLVSLMHANNEIGNITNIEYVGGLCSKYEAIFHCDMVQTIGSFKIDFEALNIDIATASAHKFHGPKGIGFIYINNKISLLPLLYGGAQERNIRAGTENLYGIIGMGKALEISHKDMVKNKTKILSLKKCLIDNLILTLPEIEFNGDCNNLQSSLYSILNIRLPKFAGDDMLLYNMDIGGISVSYGSACTSGTNIKSHVIDALDSNKTDNRVSLRISMSKYNTEDELMYTCKFIQSIIDRSTNANSN